MIKENYLPFHSASGRRWLSLNKIARFASIIHVNSSGAESFFISEIDGSFSDICVSPGSGKLDFCCFQTETFTLNHFGTT